MLHPTTVAVASHRLGPTSNIRGRPWRLPVPAGTRQGGRSGGCVRQTMQTARDGNGTRWLREKRLNLPDTRQPIAPSGRLGEARGWRGVEGGSRMQSETRAGRVQRLGISASQVAEERREGDGARGHREGALYASRIPDGESTAGLGRPRSRRESFMADRGGILSTPSNPRLSAPTVARNGGWERRRVREK